MDQRAKLKQLRRAAFHATKRTAPASLRTLASLGLSTDDLKGMKGRAVFLTRLVMEGAYRKFRGRVKDLTLKVGSKNAYNAACIEFHRGSSQAEKKRILFTDTAARMLEVDEKVELEHRKYNRRRELMDKIESEEKVNYRDEVAWAFQYFPVIVGPGGEVNQELLKSAPSPGAAGLLMWAAAKPDVFYGQLVPKVLGSTKALEKEIEVVEEIKDDASQLSAMRDEIRRLGERQ